MTEEKKEEKLLPKEAEEPKAPEEALPDAEENELEKLRKENKALSEELEQRKKLSERLEEEISEFSEMFPQIPLSEVPDEIWAEVKKGLPLSAAFARHEKKRTQNEARVKEVNENARERSSGAMSGAEDYYYTPDEVKRMSSAEVKKNYSHIISSMKHWN